MTRIRRHGIAAALAVFVALVCVPTATASAASTPKAPDGYETARVKAAAISVALPDDWLKVDPTDPDVGKALAKSEKANPKLGDLTAKFQQLRGSIKLWAIDTNSTGAAANMLLYPAGVPASALDQPQQAEASLTSQVPAAQNLHAVTTKLPGVAKVLAITYSADVATADGSTVPAYGTILLVPTPKGVMDITYTSGTPQDQDDVLDTLTSTLRVLK